MKLKLSERIVDYFIQALFIFVSVFLAFWLTNYQAKQEEKRITQEVKNVLYQELSTNLRGLEKSEVYHNAINSKARDFFNTKIDTITRFDLIHISEMPNRFTSVVLTNGASNLATDYKVRLPIHVKSRISLVYEEQKLYTETYKKLYDEFLFSSKLTDKKLVRDNYLEFYRLNNKLLGREKVLIENMKEAIKQINN